MTLRQSCPRCGENAPGRALSCSKCGRDLLYGLVAGPVDNRLLMSRAARVLAAVANGPAMVEARRRLAEGLPLIVGLSRAEAETLQQQLVGLGLVPRLGPAPEGTEPLHPPRRIPPRKAWLGVACAGVVIALVYAYRPSTAARGAPGPMATPTTPVRLAVPARQVGARHSAAPRAPEPPTVPEDRRLEFWARVLIGEAALIVEGWARVRTSDAPPEGPLTILGRAAGAEVLSESLPEWQARTLREPGAGPDAPVTRMLPFRVNLSRARVGSASELRLEATWDSWRSEPLTLEIPAG